ncbi:CRAL/TRIO domain-containing protein, partial [Penicillium macrosclerotiorum]|uniref:CRAL/TRIO domain-containing protein n=1 Tax=Penicillium macrosclerotiorum TaxID=303699 RepID=UPI002547F1CF
RFVRAQQFDVNASFDQFHHFQAWCRERNISGFYKNLDVDVYDETRKMLTKTSLDGYLKFLSKTEGPASHAHPDVPVHVLHLHALYENPLQFVFPLVSELPRLDAKHPVSSSTHIVDIRNLSVFQFWSIRKYLQEASRIATTHYPKTLGRVSVSKLFLGLPTRSFGLRDRTDFVSGFQRSCFLQIGMKSNNLVIFVLSSSESELFSLANIAALDLPKEQGWRLEGDR